MRIIAALLGTLVLGWTATVQAQTTAPTPAPAPETTALTHNEILMRHLHLLTPQEPTPEGILAHEPTSQVAAPLLRRIVPGLAEAMEQLPPFLRDTMVKLHLRSFYFNRLNSDDTRNEAWAFGGWLSYKSGWLWDAFALGAVGYTSQPLYAPEDRGGTDLLHPTAGDPQDSILVLGQAYAQLRYEEYALVTGYRQLVDEGYLNPHDSRMVPKTFEGVTIRGTIGPIGYNVGYLTAIKLRQENKFHNMAEAAGVGGDHNRGLILTRLSSEPLPGVSLYAANYLVPDVFNTAYGFAEYTHNLTSDLSFKIGLQATDQRSVGAAFLDNFKTWNVNTRGILIWRGLGVGAGFSATGDGSALQTPYGDRPATSPFRRTISIRHAKKRGALPPGTTSARGPCFPVSISPGFRCSCVTPRVGMRPPPSVRAISTSSGTSPGSPGCSSGSGMPMSPRAGAVCCRPSGSS